MMATAKKIIPLIFIFLLGFAATLFAQEICTNGIDDDGDGQIDLNDSECFCTGTFGSAPSSLIPNPSFEDLDCCPDTYGAMDCATSWDQASAPTTDYYNTCYPFLAPLSGPAPTPIPDGDGFIGIYDDFNWKEYAGACLNSSLVAGTSYTLEFYLGFGPGTFTYYSPSPYEIFIYGTTDCSLIPFGGNDFYFGCPTNGPGFVELGSSVVVGANEWVLTSITFTPTVDYEGILLGPGCDVVATNGAYYYLDNLLLSETAEFTNSIAIQGDPCTNDLVLSINSFPSATYQWFLDGIAIAGETDTFYTVPPNALGEYAAMLTVGADCALTQGYLVESNQISVNVSALTASSCASNSDGSATATASDGVAPYTYLWDNGELTMTATNLDAGLHYVTVTDVGGCSNTGSVQITELVLLTLSLVDTDSVTCYGLSDGSISITVTGGSIPYSYAWSNGAATANPGSLPAGNYSLTVTDDIGCSVSLNTVIYQPDLLEASAVVIGSPSCNGGSNGSVTASATGGTMPYTYAWSNGAITATASSLSVGPYTVLITDSNNCTATAQVTIQEPDLLEVTVDEINNVSCNGGSDGSITIAITGGTNPYTINWNNGAATLTNGNLAIGNHTVTVTDQNGCVTFASALVEQPPLLSVSLVEANDVSCFGLSDGSILINATGGLAPYTYDWSNGAMSANPGLLSAGNYGLVLTDDNGCVATINIDVAQPDILDATIINVGNISCNGQIDGTAEAQPFGGTALYSYNWDNGEMTQTAVSLGLGWHSVTVTDSHGCTVVRNVNIQEPDILGFSAVNPTNVLCNSGNSGSISVLLSGGTQPYFYLWNTGETTSVIENLPAGNYTVTVTDINGCTANDLIGITEPSALMGQTFGPSPTSCKGANDGQASVFGIGGTGPYSYEWDDMETGTVAIFLGEGMHEVTITDANGCIAISSVYIDSPSALTIVEANTQAVSCFGEQDGGSSLTISGGTPTYSYSWNGAPFTNMNSIGGLSAGTHTVLVRDANACLLGPINLTVTSPDLFQLAVQGEDPVCWAEESGWATAVPTGGTPSYTYEWSNGATGQTAFNLDAGNYTVTVSDANGCKQLDFITLGQPSRIMLELEKVDNDCYGGEAGVLSVVQTSGGTAPYIYSLDDGPFTTSGVFTSLPAGNYLVTVEDIAGCQITQTAFIEEGAEIIVDAGADQTIDLGESTQIETVVTSTWDYELTWSPLNFLNCEMEEEINCLDPTVLLPHASTDYLVTIIDEKGCVASDVISILVEKNQDVFIPNVFTPNADGQNDVFTIFAGPAVAKITRLIIYDRWGELVFEGLDFSPNDPAFGWNGDMRGKAMALGVFVYYTEIEFIDGRKRQYEGSLTLLR